MRSGNVGVLKAITQRGLYLNDTWERDICGCLSSSLLLFFFQCSCLFATHMICACLSLSSPSVPPWTLLFIVLFLNALQRVQNQSLFGTCCLRHLACVRVILFLPAGGKYLFVFLIVLKTFCAMLVFPLCSRRNIIKFLG